MIERVKGTNWLDVSWDECELMWKWVSEQYIKRERKGIQEVYNLKIQWLEDNGYKDGLLTNNCLFCEYTVRHDDMDCDCCPGKAVDESFLCSNLVYHHSCFPVEFYEKIKDMNRRRKNENA